MVTKNLIFKNCKYRTSQGYKVRIFRAFHDKKFEAIAFMFGKRIFWIFTKEAYQNWPATNG